MKKFEVYSDYSVGGKLFKLGFATQDALGDIRVTLQALPLTGALILREIEEEVTKPDHKKP